MTEETTQPESLAKQGNALHQAVDFGEQVDAFLQGEIGKYLLSCADAQVEVAVEQLKVVDAEDPKAIRFLQNRVEVGTAFRHWLECASDAGKGALEQLNNPDY